MTDFEVVILAAGEGKRMRSGLPKVLQPAAGRPLLAWVIAAAREVEPAAIHIVYRGESIRPAIEAALGPDAPALDWVEQPRPLGTGDALARALPAVPDGRAVLVLYGDVPGLEPA